MIFHRHVVVCERGRSCHSVGSDQCRRDHFQLHDGEVLTQTGAGAVREGHECKLHGAAAAFRVHPPLGPEITKPPNFSVFGFPTI